MPWTTDRVRKELPGVQVRFRLAGQAHIVPCVVRGRRERFAVVMPYEIGSAVVWRFSWAAIAYSLNSGRPLEA